MNSKKIIFVIILIAIAAGLAVYLKENQTDNKNDLEEDLTSQVVSEYDPLDITLDFYEKWLAAAQESSSTPFTNKLFEEPLLSSGLRERLSKMPEAGTIDPVICQDPIPEKIRTKISYELPEEVQMFIFSKEQGSAGQSVITLRKLNEGWYIHDISCSKEFEEPKEFTFENEGHLLKDSMPAPYSSENWHLIYERDGVQGYVVPLFFDTGSNCGESTCDINNFSETDHVTIKGNMTEAGVEVKVLEYVQ